MKRKISLIVPIYNASTTIKECLFAISNQTINNFEVILVDDCSTDNTAKVIQKYKFKKIYLNKHGGASRARNIGANNSTGDTLVFIDADIVLKPDSIENIVLSLSKPDTDAVSGIYTKNVPRGNFFSQFQNLFLIYRHSKLPEFTTFIFSSFCAVNRNAFENVGGYNEKMHYYEDVEVGNRLTQNGYRSRVDASIEVTHLKHYSHLSLLCDYFRKAAAAGGYYRRNNFVKNIKGDNCPLLIKLASVSSVFILFSLGLLKVSPYPFFLFLIIYSFSISSLLFFLGAHYKLLFSLRSYIVCFEIFLVINFALFYGILFVNKND